MFCVSQVFTKYILLFKVNKYDFFLPRIKCTEQGLTSDGNFQAQFKLVILNSGIFHLIVYHFSLSLGCILSTVIIFHSSNPLFISLSKKSTNCLVTPTPTSITLFKNSKIIPINSPLRLLKQVGLLGI